MKSLSEKQLNTIKIAEWFCEDIDTTQGPLTTMNILKLSNVIETEDGMDADRAFLLRTDRGKTAGKVKDLKRFARLLKGHNNAAMHNKMWSEGFREGTLYKSDFKDEPDYIREFVNKAYEGSKSNKYSYVQRAGEGPREYIFEMVKAVETLKMPDPVDIVKSPMNELRNQVKKSTKFNIWNYIKNIFKND